MNLKRWEPIIWEIMQEWTEELSEIEKGRILLRWRAKLERGEEPLPLHVIDEIVREVRRRWTAR